MKTKASSTASAWGIKRCICPCAVSTLIACGGSNLYLSIHTCTNYIKRVQQLFFYTKATKLILVLLSKNIAEIRYSKFCILYHITYTTIEALLYQPLRFILTFTRNRSMMFLEGSIANMTCINLFMHPF